MFKLVLLAVLIILGIVFVSDDFVAQVERKVIDAGNYTQQQLDRRVPGLKEEFGRKVEATRRDLDQLYQRIQNETWPAVGKWIADHQLNLK